MQDIPMIFSQTNLILIREGIKTVTRRPVRMEIGKPVPTIAESGDRIYVRTRRPFIKKEDALAWLEVIEVSTEHVQDISNVENENSVEEMIAEGITIERIEHCQHTGIGPYEHLWQSMYKNTTYDWAENPLVWVIRFRYIGDTLEQGESDDQEEKDLQHD